MIATWAGVVVVLLVLNVAFHGTLKDEFKVPGTDFQKATDLINAKFGAQKGAALRVVMAAPEGERLDTPERQAAVAKIVAAAQASEKAIDASPRDAGTIADPLASDSNQLSKSGRVAFFDAQYDQRLRPAARRHRQARGQPAQHRRAGRHPGRVHRRGRELRRRRTLSIMLGLLAGFIILLVLFRALVPTVIPLLFAIAAVASAFLLLFLLARYTNFNTIVVLLVPMIGLGVGIDYTLFIVTRFRQMLHDGLTRRRPRPPPAPPPAAR